MKVDELLRLLRLGRLAAASEARLIALPPHDSVELLRVDYSKRRSLVNRWRIIKLVDIDGLTDRRLGAEELEPVGGDAEDVAKALGVAHLVVQDDEAFDFAVGDSLQAGTDADDGIGEGEVLRLAVIVERRNGPE